MSDLTNALLSMETNQQTLLNSKVKFTEDKSFKTTVKVDWNDEEFPIYANITVVNNDNRVVIPLNNIEKSLGLHNVLRFIRNVISELELMKDALSQAHYENKGLSIKQAKTIEAIENLENNNKNETRKS